MRKCVMWGLVLLFGAALAGMPSTAAAELKVGISGFTKLDVQYSDKLIGGVPSPPPGATPLDTDLRKDNTQTNLDARQSRLRATFSDEVKGVKLSGRIETDFFTGDGNSKVSNSRHLRLRHAFAKGEHPSGFSLLAGQTWSTTFNLVAQPRLVDFNGPAGQLFARQPQLRLGYKTPLNGEIGTLLLEAAVESNALTDLDTDEVDEGQGEAQHPLWVGRATLNSKLYDAEAAVAVADNVVIMDSGANRDETAWMFQGSAQVKFDAGVPVRVMAHYQHIDGLARLGNADFNDAFLIGSKVENVETDGFYVGLGVALTKATSLNGVFGWNESDFVTGGHELTDLETHQSIHVNILHNFWERFRAGLEYRRFDVEAFNGIEGDVNFVHGAVWFFF